MFNAAQATLELDEYNCWIERLSGFGDIYKYLHQGFPVIANVKMPLLGQSHVEEWPIVVMGYDALQQKVICMNPENLQEQVSFDLLDFTNAWNQAGKIAFVFCDDWSEFEEPLIQEIW